MKIKLLLIATAVVVAVVPASSYKLRLTPNRLFKWSKPNTILPCSELDASCEEILTECIFLRKQCTDFNDSCLTSCGEDIECIADCDDTFANCIAQDELDDCEGDYRECTGCECSGPESPEQPEEPEEPEEPDECDLTLAECRRLRKQCNDFNDACLASCGEDIECIANCDDTFANCIAQDELDDCEGDWTECKGCGCEPKPEEPEEPEEPSTEEPEEPSIEEPEEPSTEEPEEPSTEEPEEPSTEEPEVPSTEEPQESGSEESSEENPSCPTCPPECPCGGDDEDEEETPEEEEEWDGDDPDDPSIKPYDPCQDWPEDMKYVPDLRNCHFYWACINGIGWKFKCPPTYKVFDWRRQMCVKGKRKKHCDRPFCGRQDKGKFCGRRIKTQCKKYRQCLNGTVVPLMCGDGYVFDDITEKCEKDWIGDCLNCPIFDDEHDIMKFPNRKDCNKYYVCSRSNFYPQDCHSKLHYSEISERCEDPEKAECKYSKYLEEQGVVYGASYYAALERFKLEVARESRELRSKFN